MIWYGVIFVALFQGTTRGMYRRYTSGAISAAQASLFVMSMVWASIIVEEYPSNAQYIGGSLILASVSSTAVEKYYRSKRRMKQQELEGEVRGLRLEEEGVAMVPKDKMMVMSQTMVVVEEGVDTTTTTTTQGLASDDKIVVEEEGEGGDIFSTSTTKQCDCSWTNWIVLLLLIIAVSGAVAANCYHGGHAQHQSHPC